MCSTSSRRRPTRPGVVESEFRTDLLDFLTAPGEPIELWAWMAGYDHVVLAQLWGDMRALPRAIPRFTHELRQAWEDAGSPPLPPDPPGQHDALVDARHNLVKWRLVQARRAAGFTCATGE